MRKNRIKIWLVACLVIFGCFVSACAIDVTIDGNLLSMEAEPVIQNSRTMVPLRDIFESLGATVRWEASSRTASAQKGDQTLKIQIGQPKATVNNTTVSLDAPATIINGHTMVPLRFVAEALQARVLWDNSSKSVHILSNGHKNLVVDYMDAERYDCTLLSCGGEYMLINTGNIEVGEDVVSYLQDRNVKRLKYVVATYPDLDHVGGIEDVLNAIPTDEVILAQTTVGMPNYTRLLESAQSKNVPVSFPQKGDSYSLGETNIQVVAAEAALSNESPSLVLQADYGNTTFLFVGAFEDPTEQVLSNDNAHIKCDVLKVRGYTQRSDVHDNFLSMATPTTAIISCGERKLFDNPNQSALDKQGDIPVWRTAVEGDIVAISNGDTCQIAAAKGTAPVPAPAPTVETSPSSPSPAPAPAPAPTVETPAPVPTPEPVVETPAPTPTPEPVVEISVPAPPPAPSIEVFIPDPQPSQRGNTVYITKKGKRYHYDSHCNGGTYYESTLEEALSRGLTPCKKCAK